MQCFTKAIDQPGQQGKSVSQPDLAITMQTRPDVVGGDADILALCGEQFFSQFAGQRGIRAGEFVHFFAHLLEVIVIAGVNARRLILCDRLQPVIP
ncbi:hypothetical protein D3C80_1580860 [compost metagenome]